MLYIVGTPIGNLEDLSLRQAKTIMKADIILTEDTRSTGLLKIQIEKLFSVKGNENQQLISYYKDNEFEKLPFALLQLKENKNVVMISESGMPLLSDPGFLLLKEVKQSNIPYTVIPGPSSITTAVVHSGIKPNSFVFMGFMPKKSNDKSKQIQKALNISKILNGCQILFFESPNRLHDTLTIIQEIAPDTHICICRELTKKFEEIVTGKASELLIYSFKGEIVLILSDNK